LSGSNYEEAQKGFKDSRPDPNGAYLTTQRGLWQQPRSIRNAEAAETQRRPFRQAVSTGSRSRTRRGTQGPVSKGTSPGSLGSFQDLPPAPPLEASALSKTCHQRLSRCHPKGDGASVSSVMNRLVRLFIVLRDISDNADEAHGSLGRFRIEKRTSGHLHAALDAVFPDDPMLQ
jgi:hypothetical protein